MKKQLFILAVSSLLLVSCGSPSGSSSSSSIVPSSPSSPSSSTPKETDVYLASLAKKTPFYEVKRDLVVSKNKKTLKQSHEYTVTDNVNKIEHRNGIAKMMAGYEDNLDEVTISSDVYETETKTYSQEDDGKYHVKDSSRSDFSGTVFSFDYSVASSLSVTYLEYEATLVGLIDDNKLSTFLGEKYEDGISDFGFSAVLSKSEATLASFAFVYEQNGFEVSIEYEVNALPQTIDPKTVEALV